MMLAHYLWQRTPRGGAADEATWIMALDQAAADSMPLMHAIWRALTVNERRMTRALALTTTPLFGEDTAAAVGIKRTSIARAIDSLRDNADVIQAGGRLRLADPMFEFWLTGRGLVPEIGDENVNDH